ncbi:MAG: response regulator transcription factor [Candidatus Acidiferrum sp.]
MATAARQRPVTASSTVGTLSLPRATVRPTVRVFVAAETELQLEVLTRLLRKNPSVEIAGIDRRSPFEVAAMVGKGADILLLTSCGNFLEDLTVIRSVRSSQPSAEVVMLGSTSNETEFLQCVRAGVHGYLARDASPEEILEAIFEVRAGAAVCPGKLCVQLFRYFEAEAKSLPSASIHQRMGLTRREQQLVPLVARGLTNKEIANHFSLSEQTVKNHLYRMKHKIGAEDRLSIVHLCRMQGFMV